MGDLFECFVKDIQHHLHNIDKFNKEQIDNIDKFNKEQIENVDKFNKEVVDKIMTYIMGNNQNVPRSISRSYNPFNE